MDVQGFISEQVVAGWLLILCGLVFAVGGTLYAGRAILKWPIAGAPTFLRVERGFIIAALLIAVLGLNLLERLLEAAGEKILAPSGMILFFSGAVLIIVAEVLSLSGQGWNRAAIVLFIVLAFVGQAVFGASILRSGFLPAWVGWATIIWNLVWLIILPIARPADMYYPWLHYVAPLLIGIALLGRG